MFITGSNRTKQTSKGNDSQSKVSDEFVVNVVYCDNNCPVILVNETIRFEESCLSFKIFFSFNPMTQGSVNSRRCKMRLLWASRPVLVWNSGIWNMLKVGFNNQIALDYFQLIQLIICVKLIFLKHSFNLKNIQNSNITNLLNLVPNQNLLCRPFMTFCYFRAVAVLLMLDLIVCATIAFFSLGSYAAQLVVCLSLLFRVSTTLLNLSFIGL